MCYSIELNNEALSKEMNVMFMAAVVRCVFIWMRTLKKQMMIQSLVLRLEKIQLHLSKTVPKAKKNGFRVVSAVQHGISLVLCMNIDNG